jgi:peptidoglycan/LPS O-acetylase OafA/YrhL
MPENSLIDPDPALRTDDMFTKTSGTTAGQAISETAVGTASRRSAHKYRADIDGLRAVAVLSVLAFHMQTRLGPFGGGFVGVDVFFVISGYLISSVILPEIQESRFSLVTFYERRIRRIFPALLVMLSIVSVLAYIYLLPAELQDFAKSLFGAICSFSNFYFFEHSGYFDSPLSNPLLHTWSLAVEEQFYLLFPLILLMVRRLFQRRFRLAVVALSLLSLTISAIQTYTNPTAAFYMPYTRAWELLLGTILSLKLFPAIRSVSLRNLGTIAGLALILISVHCYTSATPFPGLAALVPCVGAALIIGVGESGTSAVGALLSWRPVVFIGLISYSLYLWHWPIIVFKNMGAFSGTGSSHRLNMMIISLSSMVVASISWRFVERPFRTGQLRLSGAPLFGSAALSSIALVGLAMVALFSGGLPYRYPVEAVRVASYLGVKENYAYTRMGSCFITTAYTFANYDAHTCLREIPSATNDLLIGDSHSAVLWHALATSLPNTNIMEAAASGCKPFVDLPGNTSCAQLMHYIYSSYLPTHPIDALLVVGRWDESDIPEIGRMVAWSKERGIPLVLFGPVQEYDAPLPRLLAYSIAENVPKYPYQHRVVSLSALDRHLQSLADSVWHVRYISLIQTLCDNGSCREYADRGRTVPMMYDRDHLSHGGSVLVVQTLVARGQLP